MSMLVLSAVLSTVCATATPALNDNDIQNAITMIANELLSRHNEKICCRNHRYFVRRLNALHCNLETRFRYFIYLHDFHCSRS